MNVFHVLTTRDLEDIVNVYELDDPQPLVVDGRVALLHYDNVMPDELTNAIADRILENTDAPYKQVLADIAPNTIRNWDPQRPNRHLTYWPSVTLFDEYPA